MSTADGIYWSPHEGGGKEAIARSSVNISHVLIIVTG
jgi:hypothetical protein